MRVHSRFFVTVATIFSVGISAGVASAFEPSSEAEKLLVSWLEEGDCSLAQSDFVDKMSSGPGVSGSDMMDARRAMTRSRVIRQTANNGMLLTVGSSCENVEIPEPDFSSNSESDVAAKKLMALFENSGCVLTQRNAIRLAEANGMTEDETELAAEVIEHHRGFTKTADGIQLLLGKCKGVTPDGNAQYKAGVETDEPYPLMGIWTWIKDKKDTDRPLTEKVEEACRHHATVLHEDGLLVEYDLSSETARDKPMEVNWLARCVILEDGVEQCLPLNTKTGAVEHSIGLQHSSYEFDGPDRYNFCSIDLKTREKTGTCSTQYRCDPELFAADKETGRTAIDVMRIPDFVK